ALSRSLRVLAWGAVFVDECWGDGTPDGVSGLGNQGRRVFALNRLTATSLRPPASKECWRAARLMVAVMDADPQHKRLLSRMLDTLKSEPILDAVAVTSACVQERVRGIPRRGQ